MAEVTNKYGYIVDYDEYLNELLIYNQTVFPNNVHYDVMVYGTIYEVYDSSVIIPVTPPEPPPSSITPPLLRLSPIPETAGDIGLFPDEEGNGDCLFMTGDIQCDAGLQTAVYISLFTDVPADSGDERRGWWGDSIDDIGVLGSKLWTLQREKIVTGIADKAKQYCVEALQWMIDTGVASSLDVVITRDSLYSLNIEVTIYRPTAAPAYYQYSYNWTAQQMNGY